MISIDQLNTLSQDEFTNLLGDVFEHSAWVAQEAWLRRPFTNDLDLHKAMCAAVARAGLEPQLRLIRAHPQLAGKAAVRGELTDASTREQRGAGLDQCSPEEFASLTALNEAYQAKFGFPFILAVRGHTRQSIIDNMATRLDRPHDEEVAEALRQIERIAAFRLADMIGSKAPLQE